MKIGLLSFGGGYASIPLVEKEVVEIQKWMTYEEFADLLALDELTPGPILINSATFVGMKVDGLMGAIAATLGCILPSIVLSLLLIYIYRRYSRLSFMESIMRTLKCMAIALILTTLLKMVNRNVFAGSQINYLGIFLMIVSFFVLRKYRINPLYVMLVCGIISVFSGLII